MRAIWEREKPPPLGSQELNALAELELAAAIPLEMAISAAEAHGRETLGILTLAESAKVDLNAGCDLARHGYFKQAYALWRSWLEQTMFALYFLEAPLHRQGWEVVEEIKKPGGSPQMHLMLHQFFQTAPDKRHPFHVVYSTRFTKINGSLRRSPSSKTDAPLKQLELFLSDLSQGVHGTYSPTPLRSAARLSAELSKHILPILKSTDAIVCAFCFAYIWSLLDLSDEQFVALRESKSVPQDEDEKLLAKAIPLMRRWLDPVLSAKGPSHV